MSNCDSCSSAASCDGNCSKISKEKCHELSKIKKVIGVMSGKGGVGKSSVTGMLALLLRRQGYNVGILDADILGPSIPKMFGITSGVEGTEQGIFPKISHNNIEIMSVNLLLENPQDPVIWRGSMVSNVVKQFWTDVIWNELDFLFIDMPPGTGDVPLTVFQSIPIDGVVIVTSPQDLVKEIVKKSIIMTQMMNIPVLGLIENYSYIKCPDCDRLIELFGSGKTEEIAKEFGIPLLAKIPLDSNINKLSDLGEIEKISIDFLDAAVTHISSII